MMILRVPHTDAVLCRTFYGQRSTRIVHYVSTIIWCYGFDGLHNDQLSSAIKAHGVDYDGDGWVWND